MRLLRNRCLCSHNVPALHCVFFIVQEAGRDGGIDGEVSLDDKKRNVNSRQENSSLRRT